MRDKNINQSSKRDKITVCIIAGNEESNIRRCLESVRWADEIVVVDSFSTDKTREIALGFTDRVFQHRWLGYIGQKVLAKTLSSHPWVMFVDADEEVSDALRDEILSIFDKGVASNVDGFAFPRMVWFLGRWIRHGDWYPDTKLRLFRKARGNCTGSEPHDRIYVEGDVQYLKAPLHHYTYNDISDQIFTLNRFSSISAQTHVDNGGHYSIFRLIFHPPFRFLRSYLLKCGFMDGVPGFIVAGSIAFATLTKYAKIWEIRKGVSSQK